MKNRNVKELLNEIKCKCFVHWEKLHENDKETEIKIKLGKIKDMHKDKVTLNKLFDIIVEFKDQVNDRLDRIEKDVALIKSCPTIKKEITKLSSEK